jgi:hypothetical protein
MTPDMTAEKAKDILLEEHRRTIDIHPEDIKSSAYAGRFGKQARPDRADKGGVLIRWCTRCKRSGHIEDTC